MNRQSKDIQTGDSQDLADRRAFLAKCGKFAAVTPPALALMLSAKESHAFRAYGSGINGEDK